jgi:hypothetical protein
MFKVERVHSAHDITCHSKSRLVPFSTAIEPTALQSLIIFYVRRNKKKKIPLVNNEEVDMDLSAMDDSPVLWIR